MEIYHKIEVFRLNFVGKKIECSKWYFLWHLHSDGQKLTKKLVNF